MNQVNTAILIIDDEEMVRDNIEEILCPREDSEDSGFISDAVNVLFDTPKPLLTSRKRNMPVFSIDKAANGSEGLKKVIQAVADGQPYAVIFLDMRMPGWSGLETAVEIRKHDVKAEIIFITAYSDRSIDEVVEQAGQNVGYHCKPYAPEEIIQLATKAVTDYNRLRNLERLIESVSEISFDKSQLHSLLKNILDQIAQTLETDMALMGKLDADFSYEKVMSTGTIEESIQISELVNRIKDIRIEKNEVMQFEDLVLARMENYFVFSVLKTGEKVKTEKMYLLRLFVQNAGQAILNAELSRALAQKEKLSAVGQVITMVMHDLRSPIKNIKLITQLIREDGNTPELIDMIDQSAEQASGIFDDFLDFVKETPVKKLPVLIKKVAAEAICFEDEVVRRHNITIKVDIPANLIVSGDESKLRRSITNLVNNAVDVLKSQVISDPEIIIRARQSAAGTVLEISDNGPGVPEEILTTLFEPFVTKNKSGGTGLGLAIVKQYITAHGGDIIVRNDGGALFTINLP